MSKRIIHLKQKATTLWCGKYVCLVVSGHNSKLYLSLLFSEESQALQPYLQDILCDFSDIHDNSPSQSQTQTLSHTKYYPALPGCSILVGLEMWQLTLMFQSELTLW